MTENQAEEATRELGNKRTSQTKSQFVLSIENLWGTEHALLKRQPNQGADQMGIKAYHAKIKYGVISLPSMMIYDSKSQEMIAQVKAKSKLLQGYYFEIQSKGLTYEIKTKRQGLFSMYLQPQGNPDIEGLRTKTKALSWTAQYNLGFNYDKEKGCFGHEIAASVATPFAWRKVSVIEFDPAFEEEVALFVFVEHLWAILKESDEAND